MPQLYTNDATSTLLAGITDVATSLSVLVADAGKFPAITAPDFFDITVKEAGAIEVMRITARAAEVMTIASRAREGTIARAFTTAASVTLGITAANASTVTLHVGLATGAHAATAISNTPAGSIAATTVQAAIDELDTEKLSNAAGAVLTANLADAGVTTGKIADAAVTYAKLQDVTATDRLLGRVTAGAGDAEEIVCTPFARTVLDDASQATALTTLGVQLNATVAITAAYTVVAADRGKLFDCSGTFTISLTAAATLGDGFSFAVRNSGTGVVTLDPNLVELVDGVATITYAAGVSSLVTCNGTAFKTVGLGGVAGVLHVRDEKSAGTTSGSSVAGDQTRTLNTVVKNTIAGASLATNNITLPAGTYHVKAVVPVWNAERHRARLYNVTDAVNAILGTSMFAVAAANVNNSSQIQGQITITATKVFSVVHYIQTAAATYGLGVNASDTFIEVYADIFITKVA